MPSTSLLTYRNRSSVANLLSSVVAIIDQLLNTIIYKKDYLSRCHLSMMTLIPSTI